MDLLGLGMKREADEECPGSSMHSLSEVKPRKNRQEMPFIAFVDEEFTDLAHANRQRDAYDFTGSNPPGSAQQFQFLGHSEPFLGNPAASRSGASPLTIFYNGTVNVYDVPAEKAQAIISLAENGLGNSRPQMSSRVTSSSSNGRPICTQIKPFSMIGSPTTLSIYNNQPYNLNSFQTIPDFRAGEYLYSFSSLYHNKNFEVIYYSHRPDLRSDTCASSGSGLPIARKHSLQRFLKKRKERLHIAGEVSKSSSGAPIPI